MKKIIIGFLALGITTLTNAQTTQLPETVINLNQKYINAVDLDNAPEYVKYLEEKVVSYKNKPDFYSLYSDLYDTYKVTFHIPEGKIIAVYNTKGEIVRTIEKYNDVRLPLDVLQAIAKRYPNWGIISDDYHINYHSDKDTIHQEYKIKIKNKDETLVVKTNKKGIFL